MSRRLEIELTSERPDGTWTWRQAGAKLPKGELTGALLPDGSKVGDVLKVEADFLVDGIEILSVVTSKERRRSEPQRLQILGSGKEEPLVTTTLVDKRERRGRDRGDRRDRRDGDRRGGRDGGDRPRRDGGDRPRGDRRPQNDYPERPRPKRLRPGRTHRNAVLESLPEAHRPIAEKVLQGGIPAVRQEIENQNARLAAEEKPLINGEELIVLAEQLHNKLRIAEWRDKAESAIEIINDLDLRDLRSVVVAADSAARDDETRSLAAQLREHLTRRVDEEHQSWLDEIGDAIKADRVIRALRLSSRPPKAGVPLPAEVSTKLADLAGNNLTPETTPDRWAAVLDALAFSPVRGMVVPAGLPENRHETILNAVKAVAGRIPHLAQLFGIDPAVAEAEARKARRAAQKARKPKPAPAAPKAPDKADAADAAAEAANAEVLEELQGPVDEDATGPAPAAPEAATASTEEPTEAPAEAAADEPAEAPADEPADEPAEEPAAG